MEEEPREIEIQLEPENFYISPVTSVNGQTGDVVLKTSDLENDSNYQNATEVSNAISVHNQSTSAHQDIRQAIADEATARINADNGLQGQIDAITSASDVVDIVGTYADLQAYDTQHLKDNDVIKVLQDETHNDAMTYYRWSTSTETWTYIGAEGPYYTKSETNTLLNDKLDVSAVPDGFFDGPATVTDEGTNVEVDGAIKFKSVDLLGNTVQQTYSGKNILPSDGLITQEINDVTFTPTYENGILQYINVDGTASANITYDITNLLSVTSGTTYTISGCSGGSDSTYRIWVNSSSAFPQGNRLQSRNGSGTATAAANDTNIRVYIQVQNGVTLDNQKFYPQIEVSPTSTSYEPYVGGIPAPNPSYPQTVQTVTGTQTITVTDGDVQNVYTVDLGSIELAKIGDYQDYIYKSGDDWYVHKETKKLVLDGTEGTWYEWHYSSAYITVLDAINPSTRTTGIVMSDRFIEGASTTQAVQWSYFSLGTVAIRQFTNQPKIGFKTDVANDLDTWKTWLSTHNTTVYYVLATSTDTKITNQNLIGQLNKLFNATLYQPTSTITTAGNLPAILNVEAFTDNLNSLVEIASEPNENVFVGTNGVNAGVSGLVPAPQATDAGKFLKADGTWASGGGGGTSYTAGTGIDITSDVISVDTSTIQAKLTAGSNVNISAQNVISATDTTYSDFTGTDGNTGGTAGLVPAPTTSDVDKFLKSDGTWATAGGGSGPTVVQTTGTSQTDVMSQNAVSGLIYADPSVATPKQIRIGSTGNVSNYAIRIGYGGQASNTNAVSVGQSAQATGQNSIALGSDALANYRGSVALGSSAQTTVKGQIMVGTSNTYDGYNSTNYRIISGVHDGQSANDAVNLKQLNALIDDINTALGTSIPHIGA